jgi:hypothetical protein
MRSDESACRPMQRGLFPHQLHDMQRGALKEGKEGRKRTENNYPSSSNNFLSPTRFLTVKGLINFKKITNPSLNIKRYLIHLEN